MEIVIAYYFLTFVIGLFVGSFVNLISDRIIRDEGFIFGRSHCDHCKTPLSVKDLIPVFSFVSISGKCRYCGDKLSWYYPASEILTALLFVLAAFVSNVFVSSDLLSGMVFVLFTSVFSLYMIMLLADFKYRIIPNQAVFSGIIVVLAFLLFNFIYENATLYSNLKNDPLGKYLLQVGYFSDKLYLATKLLLGNILSAFLLSMFFYLLIVFTKGRGMGGGDVKLAFLIGLFNGFPNNVLAIFLGFVYGAVFSVGLILLKRKTVKDTIAFGPFLILGSVTALLYGPQVIEWYLGRI